MTDEYTQGRLQQMETHLRNLDGTVRVLAASERGAIREKIEATFAQPRVVIIYRGVQRGLTQEQTADALRERGLTGAQQARVSNALAVLQEAGFVEPIATGGYVVADGWQRFGIERILRKTLRDGGVPDLD